MCAISTANCQSGADGDDGIVDCEACMTDVKIAVISCSRERNLEHPRIKDCAYVKLDRGRATECKDCICYWVPPYFQLPGC